VALSNLPERNPFFTGREQLLAQVQAALAERGRAALSGLGGVGKTQTALVYTDRHRTEYDYMFWVSAASREILLSGYAAIAGLLQLHEAGAPDQVHPAVIAVQRWFGSHERWLLILDNADELEAVRPFLPPVGKGHVILTTQASATSAVAQRVEIQEMGLEEGALFLLRRVGCITKDALLEAVNPADQRQARDIALQLGGLPLALDQAGTYIDETGCGLSGYLDLYRRHAPELLQRRGMLAFDYPKSVATTWVLSFDNIERANPAAAELLKFCAFLHPDVIPEEVFRDGASELGPVLGPVASDGLKLNGAIAELLKYSLLRRDPNARTLEIHRLVQAVLKQGMDEATRRSWADRAVRAVSRTFPRVEFSTWALCDRLLTHALVCAELIDQWRIEFPEAAGLLHQAGYYLLEHGRYTQAEPLLERALAIREKALGPEHPDVAASLDILAGLYDDQARYAQAKPLYRRALAIRRKALSPEHPHLATSFNNLAILCCNLGRHARAKALHQRALAIREKVLGPEHPDVAASLHNLAIVYRAQGQYAQAETFYQRALAIREKVLGSEHPHVVVSLNNLANVYCDQGQHAKAEPLYRRALTIQEKALGPEHPDVAQSLNNLARLYVRQGRYAEAEPLYQRTLAIRRKALSPEHPDVANSLYNLAYVYCAQSQPAKAEPLYQRALAVREKVLGPEHPDVGACLHNLAWVYHAQGQPAKAEPLYQRGLAIREKALGSEHPDVAASLHELANLYRNRRQPVQAEPLYRQVLAIREKALGPEHPHVAECLEDYALLLQAVARPEEAAPLEARARAIRAKGAPKTPPTTHEPAPPSTA
jgi:tetratricopeptide (TPR) repeat protein